MQIDRRRFLTVAPTALGFAPNLRLSIDDFARFLGGGSQQTSETNLTQELADLVRNNRDKLPTYERIKDSEIYKKGLPNTSYGILIYRSGEMEGMPMFHGVLALTFEIDRNDSGNILTFQSVKPEKYINDHLYLATNQGLVNLDIYRTSNPVLTIDILNDPNPDLRRFAHEIYIDQNFDGTPDRGYRRWWAMAHGVPDKAIIDLSKMKPEEADFFRQNFPKDMAKVIGAVREYLKLPPQEVQPLR